MTESGLQSDSRLITVLGIRLSGSLYAVPIETVEEVLPALPIEPLQQCPPLIRGVVFVRGHLIPVLSAAECLKLRDYTRPAEPHIVCFQWHQRLVGVEVDEATDLMELPLDAGIRADQLAASEGIFSHVVEHEGLFVRLLDPARLLSPLDPQILATLAEPS